MDEFDFDFDKEVGTSVSKLKNEQSETEYDYDNIILQNSETPSEPSIELPKKKINMNQFTKNVENKIETLDKIPIKKYNPNIDQVKTILSKLPIMIKHDKNQDNKQDIKENLTNSYWDYKDIIIYVLIFIFLNNKFIIDNVDKIYYLTFNNDVLNLIVRSLIFGMILFIIKKFNL